MRLDAGLHVALPRASPRRAPGPGARGEDGTVSLFVNDAKVGQGRVDKTIFVRLSADETFDTGLDT